MLRFEILLVLSCLSSCSLVAAGDDGSAQILQSDFQRQGDAQYQFSYETSNGIKVSATGDEIPSIHDANNNAARIVGSFSYPGADGKIYSVTYLADEAGFHPEGDHLMIPPFTPWIPGQPIDDGQYTYDNSGDYKPDNSGKYSPEDGENEDSPLLDARNFEPKKMNFEPAQNNYGPKTPGFQPSGPGFVQNNLGPKKLGLQPKIPTNPSFPQTNFGPKPSGFQPSNPSFPLVNPASPQNNSGPKNPSNPSFPQNIPGFKPKTPLDSGTDQPSYISGERILNTFRSTPQSTTTPKYLPTLEPQKTNYISGENILDTFLQPKKLPSPVTPKYLPSSSTPQVYTPGENILDAYRGSSRPTPKYLPGFTTPATKEKPLDNDIIQKAFFNKPTPHPEILLHSTPESNQK